MTASRRLLIVLMNTDPRNAEELGAPFYYAALPPRWTIRSMSCVPRPRESSCSRAWRPTFRVKTGDPKTVYDWIKEAHDQGARFWACPANLELFDKSEADLIPECSGIMGAAAMIQDIMDGECQVLTF